MAATPVHLELLTPRGAGGVAVVAVSGEGMVSLLADWLRDRHGKPVPGPVPATPSLRWLWINTELIDQVLVVARSGQVTELHLHGSAATVARVEQALAGFTARRLPDAEFLIRTALGEGQLRLGLEQQLLDREGQGLEELLVELSGWPRHRRRQAAARLVRRSRIAVAIAEPARVVLCGAQNAGKSTLMNRLLAEQRVLSGATPFLTRDPVRVPVLLDGYPYELVDTAGEGAATSTLERLALEAARRERANALRLVVVDAMIGVGPLEASLLNGRSLLVFTRCDLVSPASRPLVSGPWASEEVDQLDPASSAPLRGRIGRALRKLRGLPAAGPVGGPAALRTSALKQLIAQLG